MAHHAGRRVYDRDRKSAVARQTTQKAAGQFISRLCQTHRHGACSQLQCGCICHPRLP